MWNPSMPWLELVLRPALVYLVLLVLLRLSGKRQVGQLAPFDLVLLLILSDSVQSSMIGGDESLVGGLIAAVTLVALNYGVGSLACRSRTIEVFTEGRPQVLIHRGQLDREVMRAAHLTDFELEGALRQHGCEEVREVRCAVLETNGAISVIPYEETSTETAPTPSAAH
jgi:uncharacterized membrane protein YcaP (DUF421 family)